MLGKSRMFMDRVVALHSAPIWDQRRQSWRSRFDFRQFTHSALQGTRRLLTSEKKHVYDMSPLHHPVAERRPRILHLIPNVYVGGSTQLIADLCRGLRHRFDMEIVTSARPRNVRHLGIRIHDHPMPGNPEKLEALIRHLSPDLLHVHYWGSVDTPWYRTVFQAAEAAGKKVVQNVNTPVAAYKSRAVAENVFVSDTIRALTPDGSGRTIYPGIDFESFAPPGSFSPHAGDSVGMVYRLEPDKLNSDSILPLIELARIRPRTRILVIGDGSLFADYLRRVKRSAVAENFWFTGSVPLATLPAWYSQFRTFVAPVWQESFGQVTPFAMAMGLAVAGNRIGALPEILQSDELLGDTPEELCTILAQLLDDPKRIQMIGEQNRRIALSRFSRDEMIRRYAELYSETFL